MAGGPTVSYGRLGSIWSEMGLDYSKFLDGASAVKRETVALENVTKQSLDRLTQDWAKYGAALSVSVTAPLALTARQMQRTFAEFEQSMARTAAVSQATSQELQAMTATARELGAVTQYTATQAADAMTFLAMAGFNANEVIGAMPGVLQLAAVASLDMATAADITTNILTGYAMQVEELARVNDVLTAAMTGANTNLQQLGEAMKYAGPVATAAGIQFEEAAAAIALMGNAGIQGSMAGTSLRNTISRLLNPTAEVARTLKNLGVEVTDSSGNLLTLTAIVEQLERRGASAGDMLVLFGQRAGPAMQALVEQGSGALRSFIQRLEESGGMAERIAEQQMDTLQGSILRMRSAWDELSISLTQNATPALRSTYDSIAEVLAVAAALPPEIQVGVTTFLAMTAAAGPLILAIRGIAMALGPLTGPVGMIALAAAGLTSLGVAMATSARQHEEVQRKSFDTARALRNEANELDSLVRSFESLRGKPDKSRDEHEELERVMKRIQEIQPHLVAGYDDIGEAIERNLDPLKRYIGVLKQQSDLELELSAHRAQMQQPSLMSELQRNTTDLRKLQEELEVAVGDEIAFLEKYYEAQRLLELGLADQFAAMFDPDLGHPAQQWLAWVDYAGRIEREHRNITDRIQTIVDRNADIRQQLEFGQTVIDAWLARQRGEDPFAREPVVSQVDAVTLLGDTLEDAVRREQELWQERIDAAREGIAEYGSLSEVLTDYMRWVEEQAQRTDLEPAFTRSLLEALPQLREELEGAIQEEDTLWQARIALVNAGVEEYLREYGTLKDITQDYLDWLEGQIRRTDIGEELRGSLANAISGIQQDLEELSQRLPTKPELQFALTPEEGSIERFVELVKERYGPATTLMESLGSIFTGGDEGPSEFIPLMFEDFDEFMRRIDNLWDHLVSSGRVSTQELADVIQHQLTQLPFGSEGTDEWLRLAQERTAVLRQMKQEELNALLTELEIRAAIAEQEDRFVDADILREEARHHSRLATLTEGTEAYELEISRHAGEIERIQREAWESVREGYERAVAEMARTRTTEEEREIESIHRQAEEWRKAYREAGEDETAITQWVQDQVQAIRRRYQLLREADEKDFAAKMASLQGDALEAALAAINARRLSGLADAVTEEAIQNIEAIAEAERQAAYQTHVDRTLQERLADIAIEAKRSEWSLVEMADAYINALLEVNALYEGVAVSAHLAAQTETMALDLRRRAHSETYSQIVADIEHKARLESWSSGQLARALENEALAYARTEDERINLTRKIELLLQEEIDATERAHEAMARSRASRMENELADIEKQAEAFISSGADRIAVTEWVEEQKAKIRERYRLLEEADAKQFSADMAAILGDSLTAELDRIEATMLRALASADSDEAIRRIQEIAEAQREASFQTHVDRTLRDQIADLELQAKASGMVLDELADKYEELLAEANNMFEGVMVSARLAAEVEIKINEARTQSYSETFSEIVDQIEYKARLEGWSAGQLARALQTEALALARTADERTELTRRIELLLQEEIEATERAYEEMERSRASRLENELADIEKQAKAFIDSGADRVAVTEWEEEQKAKIRERYRLLEEADAKQFAADMAAILGDTLTADLNQIEATMLRALTAAETEQAIQNIKALADADRQLAHQRHVDRTLRDQIAELELQARVSDMSLDELADRYEELLAHANNMFEGVTVSARLAAEVEAKVNENRQRSYTRTLNEIVAQIEHKARLDNWSAGQLALALEKEALAYAKTDDERTKLTRRIELLLQEEKEATERAYEAMARSRASSMENELADIEKQAQSFISSGADRIAVTEWEEEQKAKIRERYRLLAEADAKQFSADMAELLGDSLTAELDQINAMMLRALASADSDEAIRRIQEIADAQRDAALQTHVDRTLRDQIADLEAQAKVSGMALDELADRYGELLANASKMYEGVAVSSRLAAEVEAKANEMRERASRDAFNEIVAQIEHQARLDNWGSGQLARALETEALAYAKTEDERTKLTRRIELLLQEEVEATERAYEAMARSRASSLENELADIEKQAEAFISSGADRIAVTEWEEEQKAKTRERYRLLEEADAKQFSADMAALLGDTLTAELDQIDAMMLRALASADTEQAIQSIKSIAEAQRDAALQTHVDRTLRDQIADLEAQAKVSGMALDELADRYGALLADANNMFEGVAVSSRLAAEVEAKANETRERAHRDAFNDIVAQIEHKARLENWSAGQLARALETEALAYAKTEDELTKLTRRIELLRQEEADAIEKMYEEMDRSRASRMENELADIEKRAEAWRATSEDHVAIAEWEEEQKAKVRERYRRLEEADAKQFSSDMAALLGDSLTAELDQIEATMLRALASADTEQAIQSIKALAEAQREATYQTHVDRTLRDQIADLELQARVSGTALDELADRYEEALHNANNMFEGVTVSARLAAEIEAKINETRKRSYSDVLRDIVTSLERQAEREFWSAGKLADALEESTKLLELSVAEREALEHRIWRLRDRQREEDMAREAEWNRFLVESGRKQMQDQLEDELEFAKERLAIAQETGEGILEAERAVEKAEYRLNLQRYENAKAYYRARSELGSLGTEERIKEINRLIDQERELHGFNLVQSAELRWLLIERAGLIRDLRLEEAEAALASIRYGTETLGAAYLQRDAILELLRVHEEYGEEGELSIKRIKAALDEVYASIEQHQREHPIRMLTESLREILTGRQTPLQSAEGAWATLVESETKKVVDTLESNLMKLIEMSITGSKDLGAAWADTFKSIERSSVILLVAAEAVRVFTAVSDARKRLSDQARTDLDARIADEERFARLVAAGFVGEFETATKVYTERVPILFGLFHRTITQSEQVTAESTERWLERMNQLFEDLKRTGQTAIREAFRFAPGHEMPIFMRSLREGIYDSVLAGFLQAFSEHEIYTRAMAPLFQAIDEAMEDAFSDGSFDADRWWSIVGPALDEWEKSTDRLEGPMAEMRRILAELQEELGLPFVPGTEVRGGTRLTQFTGEQRDLFVELLRPVRALDKMAGYHDAHMLRLDRMIEIMEREGPSPLGETYERYVRQEQAVIHAGQVTVEYIAAATFTGPVRAVIGEQDARRVIEKLMNDLDDDGTAAVRSLGLN